IEGGAKIKDTHEYGILTFRQALEKSSNVCFAQISDKLERRRFYKYMRDFGISVLTGIDLPGEIPGTLHKPSKWSINSKRYIAFGYEVTATPIQLAAAYATVANHGVMMKPYIVAKRRQANGDIVETHPQEIRRVISDETSRTLIDIMRGVVDSGTATICKIKGINIAGKTGTAQQLVNGHYSKEHYTSTFIGFFPAEDPQYEILVILRSPHIGYYGGVVSGPIFREIAMSILEQTGKLPSGARSAQPAVVQNAPDEGGSLEIEGTIIRPKDQNDNVIDREMPDVRGLPIDLAKRVLGSEGFTVVKANDDGVVERAEKVGGDSVRLVTRAARADESDRLAGMTGTANAPDFRGMPVARAMKFAAASNVRVQFVGDGKVVRQNPDPGAMLDERNPTVTLFGDE
ncbi:MAG TPA: penicillin-binding transpeptidase domain-containing protein, partial [Steroidobacteraceae bacterium]|nr:penicillin-binding transpeptidase domain-containing protein [Steroidobacteraceae bacterium]